MIMTGQLCSESGHSRGDYACGVDSNWTPYIMLCAGDRWEEVAHCPYGCVYDPSVSRWAGHKCLEYNPYPDDPPIPMPPTPSPTPIQEIKNVIPIILGMIAIGSFFK